MSSTTDCEKCIPNNDTAINVTEEIVDAKDQNGMILGTGQFIEGMGISPSSNEVNIQHGNTQFGSPDVASSKSELPAEAAVARDPSPNVAPGPSTSNVSGESNMPPFSSPEHSAEKDVGAVLTQEARSDDAQVEKDKVQAPAVIADEKGQVEHNTEVATSSASAQDSPQQPAQEGALEQMQPTREGPANEIRYPNISPTDVSSAQPDALDDSAGVPPSLASDMQEQPLVSVNDAAVAGGSAGTNADNDGGGVIGPDSTGPEAKVDATETPAALANSEPNKQLNEEVPTRPELSAEALAAEGATALEEALEEVPDLPSRREVSAGALAFGATGAPIGTANEASPSRVAEATVSIAAPEGKSSEGPMDWTPTGGPQSQFLSELPSAVLPLATSEHNGEAERMEVAPAEPELSPFPALRRDLDNFRSWSTLQDFGYEFRDNKLVQEGTELPYHYEVKPGNYQFNQEYYEVFGDVVINEVQLLFDMEGLQRFPVPAHPSPGQPQTFVMATPDFRTNPNLLVLIHGSGAVRAGIWARSLVINNGLNEGTQLPYVRRAKELGYAVLILNTNDNWRDGAYIPESSSPNRHCDYVFQNYVLPYLHRDGSSQGIRHIAFVAHSAGGAATTHLAHALPDVFFQYVKAIAFTDACYSRHDVSSDMWEYLCEISIDWVTSSRPMGYELSLDHYSIPTRSAGHNRHEWTSYSAMENIFVFINDKFDKATIRDLQPLEQTQEPEPEPAPAPEPEPEPEPEPAPEPEPEKESCLEPVEVPEWRGVEVEEEAEEPEPQDTDENTLIRRPLIADSHPARTRQEHHLTGVSTTHETDAAQGGTRLALFGNLLALLSVLFGYLRCRWLRALGRMMARPFQKKNHMQ